jgi:O-antigen/teichoic acid export membrane protein
MSSTISFHALRRHVLTNTAGYAVPVLVGVAAVPVLLTMMGIERFGLLTMMLAGLGLAGVFEFGLGRMLAKTVAEKLATNRSSEVPATIATACTLMVGLALIGTVILTLAVPLLTALININPSLFDDATKAMFIIALSLPAVLFTSAFRGTLQAFRRFKFILVVNTVMGSFNFIGPILTWIYCDTLTAVAITLVAGRMLATVVYGIYTWQVVRASTTNAQFSFDKSAVRDIAFFGGWMTVTNAVGPLFFFADRFVIAAILSASLVAYYTAPMDVILKILIIPVALVDVIFPEVSRYFAEKNVRLRALYHQASQQLLIVVVPIAAVLFVAAHPLLDMWLGAEFAEMGTPVVQWLSVGLVFSTMARIPQAIVQASGRPHWTAALSVGELLLYAVYLPVLILQFGLPGAAIAWALRTTIGAGVLALLANRCLEILEQQNAG